MKKSIAKIAVMFGATILLCMVAFFAVRFFNKHALAAPSSVVQTTDADFGAGTFTNTDVSGTGTGASVGLAADGEHDTVFGDNFDTFPDPLMIGQKNVFVDTVHSRMYVTDSAEGRILVMDSGAGGTTLGDNAVSFGESGNGSGQFYFPENMYADVSENKVYVVDSGNARIVVMDSGTGGTTLGGHFSSFGESGNGDGQFLDPDGITMDEVSNKMYIADSGNDRVIMMDSGTGGTTLGGNFTSFGTTGSGAGEFTRPWTVALDVARNKIYVTDTNNNRVVMMDSGGGSTTLGGNFTSFGSYGTGNGNFDSPWEVSVDTAGNKLYVTDTGNNRVTRMDSGGGSTTLGGNFTSFGEYGMDDGQFGGPRGMYFDSSNALIYVADRDNNRIAMMDSGTEGTTFGDNFISAGASGSNNGGFSDPEGLYVDIANNKMYITDINYNRVVMMDSGTGGTTRGENAVSFGTYGNGNNQFDSPYGIYVDNAHNKAYVADGNNGRIVMMDSGGGSTTLGGNFTSFGEWGSGNGQFNSPIGIAYDPENNKVYVADGGNDRIVMMDSGNGGTTLGDNFTSFDFDPGFATASYYVVFDAEHNKLFCSVGNFGGEVFAYYAVSIDSGSGGTTLGDNLESFQLSSRSLGMFADTGNNKLYATGQNSYVESMDSGTGGTTLGDNDVTFGEEGSGDNQFFNPNGIYGDTQRGRLYIADSANNRIVIMDSGTPAIGYSSSGTFVSSAMTVDSADGATISWHESSGPAISMKVRSGTDASSMEAKPWSSCSPIASGATLASGGCSNSGDTLVQYQATFSSTGESTALLDDVSINFGSDANPQPPAPEITDIDDITKDSFSVYVQVDDAYANQELDFKIRIKNKDSGDSDTKTETESVGSDGKVTFHIDGLKEGTEYSVEVKYSQKNEDNFSDYSDSEKATTLRSIENKKCDPASLKAVKSDGDVLLSWNKLCKQANGILIERKTDSGQFEQIGSIGKKKTSYLDTGIFGEGEYIYRIRGFHGNAYTHYSNTARVAFGSTNDNAIGDGGSQDVANGGSAGVVQEQPGQDSQQKSAGKKSADGGSKSASENTPIFSRIKNTVQALSTTFSAGAVAGAVAGIAIALSSSAVPLMSVTPEPFSGAMSRLLSIFGVVGKRKDEDDWGTVFDVDTKQPVRGAVISLIGDKGTVLDTAISDSRGRYGFLPKEGTYTLRIARDNYQTVDGYADDVLYGKVYAGLEFGVRENEVEKLNIALKMDGVDWNEFVSRKISAYRSFFSTAKKYFFMVLFYGGFAATACIAIMFPSAINLILVVVYAGLFVYQIVFKKKAYGVITRESSGDPVPFAIVGLYPANNPDQRSAFAVSDVLGRYYLLAENGLYNVKVSGSFLGGGGFGKNIEADVTDGIVRIDTAV